MQRRHFQAARPSYDAKPSKLETTLGTRLMKKLIKGIESQHASIPGVYAEGPNHSSFDKTMYGDAHSALRLHRQVVFRPDARHDGSETTMFRISKRVFGSAFFGRVVCVSETHWFWDLFGCVVSFSNNFAQ